MAIPARFQKLFLVVVACLSMMQSEAFSPITFRSSSSSQMRTQMFSERDGGSSTSMLERTEDDGPKKSNEEFKPCGDSFLQDAVVTDDSTNSNMVETTEFDEDWALKQMSSEVGVKKFIGQKTKPDFLPIDVIFSRTLDTIEDIMIHLRRKPYDMGFYNDEGNSKQDKKTVVVLGSGWGAHALMKVADTLSIRMIVVSPVNHFVFTPMLASASVGSVEYRSMTEAVRASNPMSEYIEGKAIDVDIENKKVKIELVELLTTTETDMQKPEPIELEYDALICAVGTKVQNSRVPGADRYCYYLKTVDDARLLRNAVGEALEYASRPDVQGKDNQAERRRRVTICIVGGGPTGVELAGELSDFFRDICKERTGTFPRLKDDVNVMLVHGGSDLVAGFEKPLREDALNSLKKRGVDVRLNTYTTEVGDGFVTLMDKYTKVEETIPIGLSVWAAGVQAVPFSEKLLEKLPESAKGPNGRVNVDQWLRAPMPADKPDLLGSVIVLGDAASYIEDPEKGMLPQTAQVAGQQGAYIARMLNRNYDMTATPPAISKEIDSALNLWLHTRNIQDAPYFHFLNLGLLAYVGGGEALSQVQIGDVRVLSWAGSVGFVLWRSVYLVKQVATRNRVLVTFDWAKTALFGRDVTRL